MPPERYLSCLVLITVLTLPLSAGCTTQPGEGTAPPVTIPAVTPETIPTTLPTAPALETVTTSKSIFIGQHVTGRQTVTCTFTAPSQPGSYHFQCDPHASVMKGQFIVT